MTTGEKAFYDLMAARGVQLVPQPKTFTLPAMATTYRPDFFDPGGVYYEVISTMTCLIRNAEKYRAFRRAYPDVCLRIVSEDGSDYRDCPAVATMRGHGGRRPGAGRPQSLPGGVVKGFSITPRHRAKVERWQAEHDDAKHFSDALRQIIDAAVPD